MTYTFSAYIEKKQRVDMYLSALFKDFSRSYIQKMIDKGQVKINSKEIKKNLKIEPRDLVEINIILESLELKPEKMDLDIVYEDENILVINKEPFTNVHPVPGEGGHSGTLVNGILYHCKEKLPCINGVERPGIVHRLDKDTSGTILIAKTDSMMSYLSTAFKERTIDKYYIAIVHGIVKNHTFTIESYIGRHPNDKTKMTCVNPVNPKLAITHGEVIDYIDNKYSVLRIKLETGRTHQIRVHLASISHFILGDNTYGNSKINKEMATLFQLKRQALHSYETSLDIYGKNMTFKSELKEDMKRLIGKIEIDKRD